MENLISVIVPVYNVEKYLSKCVDSIINQTYQNLEIILVDDESPDNCPKICDEYAKKDSRIKVIHKKNGGQSTARNSALDIAGGEYVGFVDSDDWIELDMFEKLHLAVTKENCDIAICGYKAHSTIRTADFPYAPASVKTYDNNSLMESFFISKEQPRIFCNKLIKRTLFENLRFPSLRAREDAYLLIDIFSKATKAVYIPDALYNQLIRSNSTEQSRFNLNNLATLEVCKHWVKVINEKYPQFKKHIKTYDIDARVELMTDILKSFKYRENHDLYKKLYSECEQMILADKSFISQYSNIIKHKFKFKLNARIAGFKIVVRNIIFKQ